MSKILYDEEGEPRALVRDKFSPCENVPLNITDKLNNNDPYKPYIKNKNNNYTYNPHVPIGYYKSEKKNDPFYIEEKLIDDKTYYEFKDYIQKIKKHNENLTKLINKRENELNEIYKKQSKNKIDNNLLNIDIIKLMDNQEKEFKHNDNIKLDMYDFNENFKNVNKNNEKISKLINKRNDDIDKVYKNMKMKNIDFANVNIEQDKDELNYINEELEQYEINDKPIKNEKQIKYELITNYLTKILQTINHLDSIHKHLRINILDVNKNEMFLELEFDKLTYIKQDYIYNKIINYVYSYNNKNNISPILKDIKFNIVSVINGYFM